MIFEINWDAIGLVHGRSSDSVALDLLLHHLDLPFHFADSGEVFVELVAVACAEFAFHAAGLLAHRIHHALPLLQPANLGQAFSYGFKRATSIFPWTVLAGLAFTVGSFCLFLPGLYVLFAVSMFGVKTDGPFAPEIPLDKQRPADHVFSTHVEKKLAEIRATQPRAKKTARVI